MTVLKVVFVIVLCIPVAYVAMWLIGNLITEVSRDNRNNIKKKRKVEQEQMQKVRKPLYVGDESSFDKRRYR